MASVNDKITDTRNSDRPNSARVSSTRSVGGTTLACNDLTGWPTASKVHGVTYQIDSNSNPIDGTQIDFYGIVSGSNITNFTVVDGTDNGNSVNDVVEMLPTAAWGQDLSDALMTSHNRDGSLKDGAVDSADVLASNVVTTAKILDSNVTTDKIADNAVTAAKLASNVVTAAGMIQGVQGVGASPVPTSETDVTSSSVTFSLPVASTLLITFGGEAQVNLGAYRALTVYLNIDGSNVATATRSNNNASDTYGTLARTYKADLSAGSHTIKLRSVANTAGSVALNSGYWYALVFAQ